MISGLTLQNQRIAFAIRINFKITGVLYSFEGQYTQAFLANIMRSFVADRQASKLALTYIYTALAYIWWNSIWK